MSSGCNGGLPVDTGRSMYVGDAAGRPKGGGKAKKDFSAGDLQFALNLGLQFYTPEQLFQDSQDPAYLAPPFAGFDASSLPRGAAASAAAAAATAALDLCPSEQRLYLVVGSPASGKSTLSKGALSHCTRINQDTLKTAKKCLDAVRSALTAGKSAVVDNTNRDRKTREPYVRVASEMGVPVYAIHLTTDKKLSFHLNAYRGLVSSSDQRRLPEMVINMYFSKLQEPTVEEGFQEVYTVPFVPGLFPSAEHEALFYSHLVSK